MKRCTPLGLAAGGQRLQLAQAHETDRQMDGSTFALIVCASELRTFMKRCTPLGLAAGGQRLQLAPAHAARQGVHPTGLRDASG